MPSRSRGNGGEDDGTPSSPGGGRGRQPGTVREEEDLAAEALLSGRSTGNGGGSSLDRSVPLNAPSENLITRLSGRSGGTPLGRPVRIEPDEDAEVRRSLEMENSGAVVLANQGYHVQQRPTRDEVAQARLDAGDVGNPGKDPDYLLEGRVFDCYSPVKPDKAVRGIWTQAKTKVEEGQTQRVVLNLEDWRGDVSTLKRQFSDWPIPGLKEVKAITRDGDIEQIELPPYRPMEVHPWLSNTD